MSINSDLSPCVDETERAPAWTRLFRDRQAVLATMHRKETVIAPILEREFGMAVQVPSAFNTDIFGTFTREIDRVGDQLTAGKHKLEQALNQTGATLGIASEGSFGPHPACPWLACDRELVILIDREHDLEIVGEILSTETNYRQQRVKSWAEAIAFAQQVGFPQHGLVAIAAPPTASLAPAQAPTQASSPTASVSPPCITKGIVTAAHLQEVVTRSLQTSESLHLETDMRALYNPTRMQAIEQATLDLVAKIKQSCPQCGCPGFRIVERRIGLPCAICSAPTSWVRALVYHCKKCDFVQEIPYPDGVETADPGQCAYCNP